MKATVRLFAILREKAGTAELELELPERSTVADLLAMMESSYPNLSASAPHTMIAVNTEYVESTHLLRDGDEVAPDPAGQRGFRVVEVAPQPFDHRHASGDVCNRGEM